ncbi:MAG: hypothetical protein RH860_13970 [Cytophagales bacterium]
MKRLTLYISILWLISLSVSMAVPELHVQKEKVQTEKESLPQQEESDTENLDISTSSEAIISSFQFNVSQTFSLSPKLFLVSKIDRTSISFILRDFSILTWKKLFTKIIQVHGP